VLLKVHRGIFKGVADVVVSKSVQDDCDGIGFSSLSSGSENLIAVFAVPKLEGFKFLFAFPFFYDMSAGAVDTALLESTDGLFC